MRVLPGEGESLILIIVCCDVLWFSGKCKTHIFKLSFPEIKAELVELVGQTDDIIIINLTTLTYTATCI